MKRKASKDISESPAKAPRSGETAAPADDHQDARSGAVTTSAGQQAAAAANEIAIGKEQIAEDTVSGGHGPKEDVQDENRKSDEEDGIERKVATKFIAKLQLVIESWRESSASPVDNADTTADCEQYLQDVLSICKSVEMPGTTGTVIWGFCQEVGGAKSLNRKHYCWTVSRVKIRLPSKPKSCLVASRPTGTQFRSVERCCSDSAVGLAEGKTNSTTRSRSRCNDSLKRV